MEALQLIALPGVGSRWAGEHSGQEPPLKPGPQPQDAYAQGPEAVISQPELNSDSRVNLNQALPHGGPGRQARLQWKPAGLLMGPARKRRCRGHRWKPNQGRRLFHWSHATAAPSQCLPCWRQQSGSERPSLSGPWIQLEALRPIKSNVFPACRAGSLRPVIRAPGLSEGRGSGTAPENPGCEAAEAGGLVV